MFITIVDDQIEDTRELYDEVGAHLDECWQRLIPAYVPQAL